ncbi:hypothetical protein F3Y22_tig00112349pilonHSYRG00146 [Hibiscus syriacus]|uniref:Reverse transcriptase zinc-binding domain-containing protein n=1 Tax=Hibiscus syriacus TaxID=106335 RepID=A0A6A2X0C2_HIBSY|nr:hypothetical protein F3Y22_tig00112349pilonHSYRG00146 [Hibiscus syriacus]
MQKNYRTVKSARVGWVGICSSKIEGGLGLKDTRSWNQACLIHLIRRLLLNGGSIGIAWIGLFVLKGSSFWHVKSLANYGWVWRSLLNLRDNNVAIGDALVGPLTSIADIWEAILLDRLPTKSRLLSFDINIDGMCVLCLNEIESMDHLFYCGYSTGVWGNILLACNVKSKLWFGGMSSVGLVAMPEENCYDLHLSIDL